MHLTTLPPSPSQHAQESDERLPVSLKVTMWLLGAISWPRKTTRNGNNMQTPSATDGETETSKRGQQFASVTSIIFIIILNTASIITVVLYMICYFGKTNHFLRFISFICYWPPMMSTQIICLIACICLTQRSPADHPETDIAWVDVFNETSFRRTFNQTICLRESRLPKKVIFGFLCFSSLFVSSTKVAFYVITSKNCPHRVLSASLVVDIFALMFYATFCYYLYLKRIILEEKCEETVIFIRTNIGEVDYCICKVREFFQDYLQLRKLLLPWLCFVVFSSTFGITVFFTWSYSNVLKDTNTTSLDSLHLLANSSNVPSFCAYNCDKVDFLKKGHVFFLYDIYVLSRHILTGVLPIVAAGISLDVKYIWNRLKIKIIYKYADKDKDFWNPLIKFMDKLHPVSTADLILTLLIPLMGLAFGLLGGRESNF